MNKFILSLLVVSLIGCRSASDLVYKAHSKDRGETATACGDLFPVKVEREVETIYVKGETDTIEGETIFVDCSETKEVVKVPCPPSYYRVDTFTKTEKEVIENTAKVVGLQEQNNDLISTNKRLKRQNQQMKGVLALIVALLVLYFFVKPKLKFLL